VTVEEFASAAYLFCDGLGGSVTSWIRSRAHNAAVGGVPHSAHVHGLGADVVYDAPVEAHKAHDLAASLGLTLIRESTHDHLQPQGWVPG
jgi:hypothetical protein